MEPLAGASRRPERAARLFPRGGATGATRQWGGSGVEDHLKSWRVENGSETEVLCSQHLEKLKLRHSTHL